MVDTKHLVKRGQMYSLKRRVPNKYRDVEPRKAIWQSLHTDSASIAKEKASKVWEALLNTWEARLVGRDDDAAQYYQMMRQVAESRGFRYVPMEELLTGPMDDLLRRVEAISTQDGQPDIVQSNALLGMVPAPQLKVSEALELYWSLTKDRILEHSPDQVRRWKNPRIKAVKNFIDVIGDKPIAHISRDDMLLFRDWWVERIDEKQLAPSTANKDFTHFGDVLKTINELKGLGIELPLHKLTLKEGKQASRPPFSSEWIEHKLLAPGALDGLDDGARAAFLAMVNTGARLGEIANLEPTHIILDHEFPHIQITSRDRTKTRKLKSANAERTLPLVGVSLKALREFPGGFPKYRDNASLSAQLNNYLTRKGLRETKKHTVYSLRHSLEERLRLAKVDDRIRAELFGHAYHRERYGAPSIKELTEAVQVVAF